MAIRLINCQCCNIAIGDASMSYAGVEFFADNELACGNNTVWLGLLWSNKHGVVLAGQGGGQVNNNTFIAGRIAVSSSIHTMGRYAIRIYTKDAGEPGAYTSHNNNRFINTSIEIGSSSEYGALPILVEHGDSNHFTGVRSLRAA